MKTLGQIAAEAYVRSMGTNAEGAEEYWSKCDDEQRRGWEAAGLAAAKEHDQRALDRLSIGALTPAPPPNSTRAKIQRYMRTGQFQEER